MTKTKTYEAVSHTQNMSCDFCLSVKLSADQNMCWDQYKRSRLITSIEIASAQEDLTDEGQGRHDVTMMVRAGL